MSVAGGKNNYEPKFQLSSSNNLGDMPFFWLKLRIKKGTLFIIFLMKTYLLLKLPKSRERVKQNFLSLKKFIENQFFEVVLSRHKKRFRVDWAILIFYKKFSEIVNLAPMHHTGTKIQTSAQTSDLHRVVIWYHGNN